MNQVHPLRPKEGRVLVTTQPLESLVE
jgi:hypothetical protein